MAWLMIRLMIRLMAVVDGLVNGLVNIFVEGLAGWVSCWMASFKLVRRYVIDLYSFVNNTRLLVVGFTSKLLSRTWLNVIASHIYTAASHHRQHEQKDGDRL